MNRRQKLVQQQYLNNEKAVIDRLRYIYDQSLFDVNSKIRGLEFQIGDLTEIYDWMDDDDPQKEIMRSRIQSKIYQKQYQEALQGQLDEIMQKMQTKQFLTVSDYLDECYTDGFVGTVFDQHGQGVPLIMPIDQEAMVRAVQLDSKISQGLYTRLGEDVGVLKKRITSEVTRSIATGASYAQVAKRLSNQTKIGFNRAVRIARTEGHRIQTTAAMDAMVAAKDRGADVLKQWDATLDDVTRESHRQVDGEIRELDKPFSNKLMFAGDPAGGAAEVINCRCAVLQRARWALDEDELQTLKDRAAYFGLDKSEEFDDFKKKYLKAVEEPPMVVQKPTFVPAKTIKEAEDFARNTLGLACSYKGVDLQCANDMNAAFQRGLHYCPAIKQRLRFVGSGQERNRQFKREMTDYYLNELKQKYPNRSDAWYTDWAKKFANKTVGRISGNTYAFASHADDRNPDVVKKFMGIVVNDVWGKDAQNFISHLVSDVKSGWHPNGCDTIASVFDHELAHQIDFATSLSKNGDIIKLWRSLSKQDIETGLSRYGATDIAEFIAEGYAEYCNSDSPRNIASQIGNIIERVVKGS